jgi:DNA adenine methylase
MELPMTLPGWKWPGGKRDLSSEVSARAPSAAELLKRGGRYAEFFIGGGATFLGLYETVRPAWISDTNEALVDAYFTLQQDPEPLFQVLRNWPNTSKEYYRVRALDHRSMTRVERGAWLIYLLRFCFNGLARFDRGGRFNASYCKEPTRGPVPEQPLLDVARALQGVQIVRATFDEAFHMFAPKAGDFIYLDPPYAPVSDTSDFVGYSAGGFGWHHQSQLCTLAENAVRAGADVLIHNSDVPEIHGLYKNFKVDLIQAHRRIAAKESSRGDVFEVIAHARGLS